MRRIKIVIGAVVAVVVLIVAVVAVYLLTRGDAPEAVDLETTVARIEAADTSEDGTDEAAATSTTGDHSESPSAYASTSEEEDVATTSSSEDDAPAEDAAASTDGAADSDTGAASADQTADSSGGLDGVWAVQVAENAGDLQGEPTVSFAGFRVDEVLAGGIGDFTAVGRTADVSGSIELSGNVLVATTVEVTMGTLRTDNSSRDSQVRRALGTNDFPQAIFTLVEPVDLPAGMADGEAFSGSANGDLTIKGVTNRVTFDLQAQLVDDTIVAVGSSDVVFSDFSVTAPSAPIVVSVEDHGIMEFQLLFTR